MRKNVRKRTALLGLVAVVSIAVCVILSTSPARESIAQSAEGSVGGAYGNNARVTLPAAFQENWGDVNQDGKRDSTDARLVLQYSVKKID